ncbi:MAG: M48 family metallopeptidase [Lachnospiraceae bacterium]|nr:M48 family metallopeptidase [Lachnospiraceae bacterium]
MKKTIMYKSKKIEYDLIREKRKTLSVRVNEDGSVIVKAPNWVKAGSITDFVDERAEWIYKKSQLARQHSIEKRKSYESGAIHRCLGRDYRLLVEEASVNRAYEGKDQLVLVKTRDRSEEAVRKVLGRLWYRKLKEYANEQIENYMPLLEDYCKKNRVKKREFMGVTVKNTKSRWGSCSSKGHINLNVKLVSADRDIVDYVIVHEMCHLIYLDHSKEFWEAVEYVFADYKEIRKNLNENGWKYEI